MFTARNEDTVEAAEAAQQAQLAANGALHTGPPTNGSPLAEGDTQNDAKDDKAPPGYKVIIPSPSKRMLELRQKAEPDSRPKPKATTYKSELTGDDLDKVAEYYWPDPPDVWSVIEPGETAEERIVNGKTVKKPPECSFVMEKGKATDEWILAGNLVQQGTCGSASGRDTARYGNVGEFKEGDMLLVADPKRNQYYDGGWYTGVDKLFPKPIGHCVLLEWADTSSYSGTKMDTEAWRAVWVPVSRIVKAPEQKRSHVLSAGKKRGGGNKITNETVSKMTLGSGVVYKGNAPYCLIGRNPREVCVWVMPVNGEQKLVGGDDDVICFYLEELDAFTDFTVRMARELKKNLAKIHKNKTTRLRALQKQKDKTAVDKGLTASLAMSITSSPAASDTGLVAAGSSTTTSTPIQLQNVPPFPPPLTGLQGVQNLTSLLNTTFGNYGLPRPEGFSETEFWKQEAMTFLTESRNVCQSMTQMKGQVEQTLASLLTINESVRLGVLSQVELLKKNQELFDKHALSLSQQTALRQSITKLLGARLNTEATPKTPKQAHLPQTDQYLGPSVAAALSTTTPLAYRTTVYQDFKQTEVNTPGCLETTKQQRDSTVTPKQPTQSPDTAVLAIKKASYTPSRPTSPWSLIDLNSLYFKLEPSWTNVRRQAGLRLGRPLKTHEFSALKWLFWCDNQFDAWEQFEEPAEFERFLAIITYTMAKANGTGLDGKVIKNYLKSYDPKRDSQSSDTPTLSRSASDGSKPSQANQAPPAARNTTKAQLKLLGRSSGLHEGGDPTDIPPKQSPARSSAPTHEKKGRKRGMQRGSTRKRADPKLKSPWPGRGEANTYNQSTKLMWREEHINKARKTVDHIKKKPKSCAVAMNAYRQYRFIEKLFKQMLDGYLYAPCSDMDEFKHAMISLRNGLQKDATSGFRIQEEYCKSYHFYWAAVDLFREQYPQSWHSGTARDVAQLDVAGLCAELAKCWCREAKGPPAKKRKSNSSNKDSIEHRPKSTVQSPEKKVEEEVIDEPPKPTQVVPPEPTETVDEDLDDDFEAFESGKPSEATQGTETPPTTPQPDQSVAEVDNNLVLSMADDGDDFEPEVVQESLDPKQNLLSGTLATKPNGDEQMDLEEGLEKNEEERRETGDESDESDDEYGHIPRGHITTDGSDSDSSDAEGEGDD